jgi:hypothetical protein
LVWAGSPKHKRDRYRSIALKTLKPLFDIAGVRFISLQKGPAVAQIDEFGPAANMLNLGPELDDFADAAAVIDQLDLVIGVDTAVIHLAGAMGRPVWTLIPTPSDWRWLIDREDSPWYPTMQLFRQRTRGDWQSVVEDVRTRLAEVVRGGKSTSPVNAASSHQDSASATKVMETMPASDNFSGVAETRYGIIQYLAHPSAIAKSLQLYGEYLQAADRPAAARSECKGHDHRIWSRSRRAYDRSCKSVQRTSSHTRQTRLHAECCDKT